MAKMIKLKISKVEEKEFLVELVKSATIQAQQDKDPKYVDKMFKNYELKKQIEKSKGDIDFLTKEEFETIRSGLVFANIAVIWKDFTSIIEQLQEPKYI